MAETTIKHLHKLLQSTKPAEVKQGIAALSTNGNEQTIDVLLDLMMLHNDDPELLELFSAPLREIKHKKASVRLLERLSDENFNPIRRQMISGAWNSGLNMDAHIHILASIAIKGDYETAIECMTAIDQMVLPVDEASLSEAQLILGEWLHTAKDSDHKTLINIIFESVNLLARVS